MNQPIDTRPSLAAEIARASHRNQDDAAARTVCPKALRLIQRIRELADVGADKDCEWCMDIGKLIDAEFSE